MYRKYFRPHLSTSVLDRLGVAVFRSGDGRGSLWPTRCAVDARPKYAQPKATNVHLSSVQKLSYKTWTRMRGRTSQCRVDLS